MRNYFHWSGRSQNIRSIVLLGLALSLWVIWAIPVAANGVPIQIFLDHLPFKTTWEPANGARGVAIVASNDEEVRVMAQNLPSPPSGQVYYAWLEQAEGGFLSVGALDYRSDGTASLDQQMPELPHSEHFSWVLVSLEDPGYIGNAPGVNVALAGRLPNALALPLRGNETPALLPVTGATLPGSTWFASPLMWIALALLLSLTLVLTSAWRRQQPSRQHIQRAQKDES